MSESGTRTVTTTWGVRWTRTVPHIAKKGTVQPASSRQHAHDIVNYMADVCDGCPLEVVTQRVVTNMSGWETEGKQHG